jgi:DNA topoisomerase-3
MNYICEKAARREGCTFRTGKIILQRPMEREQVEKLLTTGKTDLLDKFISKKGRPFKAYLVVKDGKTAFEFEPRGEKKTKSDKPKEPTPKIDFTGKPVVATCPACNGKVYETDDKYICENSQADKKACKFEVKKVVCQVPIDHAQLNKLISDGHTDSIDKFISKTGKPFTASLVLDDKKKVKFEFSS